LGELVPEVHFVGTGEDALRDRHARAFRAWLVQEAGQAETQQFSFWLRPVDDGAFSI
jgi:hypothetical protein